MSLIMLGLKYSAAAIGGPTTAHVLGLLIVASVKGSVLVVLAWLLTRSLHNASAAARHLVWASAMGGMLLMPLLTGVAPSLRVSGLPAVSVPASADLSPPPVVETSTRSQVAPLAPRVRNAPSSVAPTGAVSLAQWFPLIWLSVASLVLLRLVLGTWRLSYWTRRAHIVDDGAWLALAQRLAGRLRITRPITLLRSEQACVPMTWGVVYPTVLLPIDADDWTKERRTIVLLHELAHVKRLDAFTQLIAQFAIALFWFNPLVWLAARQMRTEREHACDDCVLEGGARASDYAHDLLQIARSLGGSSAPAAAALAMARRSEFEGRLLAILDPKTNRHSVSRARLVVATLCVLALAFPLAALTPAPTVHLPALAVAPAPEPELPEAPEPPLAAAAPRATTQAPVPFRDERERVGLPASSALMPPVAQPIAPGGPAQKSTLEPIAAFVRASMRAQGTPPDRETLIAVARAAGKMTSDYEKAELLLTIAKHYIRDDELRTAYLDAVTSMTSDYDRSRTLIPLLLKDDLPSHAIAQVVKVASAMSSDNSKATVLVETISKHTALTSTIQDAVIAATKSFSSDYDRARTVSAIAKRGGLTNGQVIDLIEATSGMSSSYSKATALLDISSNFSLSDDALRKAFVKAAGTLTSDSDYRRVMAGVLR